MATRTATRSADAGLDLDQYSNEELDALLFTEAPRQSNTDKANIPLLMGIATFAVTLFYILGEIGGGLLGLVGLGNFAPDVTGLVPVTLLAATVLILINGLGGPRAARKKRREKVNLRKQTDGRRVTPTEGRKLVKSRDKKIAGVAGGIAEYFGWDPKIVRAAFAVGAFVTQGAAVVLYLILAAVLPKSEPISLEERLRIIRDS